MTFLSARKRFGRYINLHINHIRRSIWHAILWGIGYYNDLPRKSPAKDFSYPAKTPSFISSRPSVVWLGHSTFLIKVHGLQFLTDPVFSSHCAPLPIRTFERHHPVPIPIKDLPPIDCILISHNHYDHLDEKSVMQLHHRFPHVQWIVPKGLKRWFLKRGIHRVEELCWGQSHLLQKDCWIHSVPAQHFSGRHFWDQNLTLWCGFVVQCKKKKFYFVGDTGYNPYDFKNLKEKWPKIDLCMIPIGTYIPSEFMKPVHINPKEAVQIHCDVGSQLSVGMHWKTFSLSEEPLDLPPYDLYLAMKEKNLPFDTFIPIQPGKSINW